MLAESEYCKRKQSRGIGAHVEVPDEIKYVQTDNERWRGVSYLQNYIIFKNRTTHDGLSKKALNFSS